MWVQTYIEISSIFHSVHAPSVLVVTSVMDVTSTNRRLGHERVYLSLHKVADTPFHIQGVEMF